MNYSIIIPSCKSRDELQKFIGPIKKTVLKDVPIILTGFPVSAATNRNYGLDKCKTEYCIMLDDDINGFFSGWAEELLKPFELCKNVVMVSARLMKENKIDTALMMNIQPRMEYLYQIIDDQFLPSACIAFKNDGTRFDENFVGSSWEDTDFCVSLQKKNQYGLWIINNKVKLIHKNEMKSGNPKVFAQNRKYFEQKHGRVP